MPRALPLLAISASLAVSGCGSKDSNTTGGDKQGGGAASSPSSSSGAAPAAVTVKIAQFKYAPPDITVKAGGTITFENADSAEHTATAMDSSFDSGTLTQGKSKAVTFGKPGTFKYTCSFHAFMHGQVTVK